MWRDEASRAAAAVGSSGDGVYSLRRFAERRGAERIAWQVACVAVVAQPVVAQPIGNGVPAENTTIYLYNAYVYVCI